MRVCKGIRVPGWYTRARKAERGLMHSVVRRQAAPRWSVQATGPPGPMHFAPLQSYARVWRRICSRSSSRIIRSSSRSAREARFVNRAPMRIRSWLE